MESGLDADDWLSSLCCYCMLSCYYCCCCCCCCFASSRAGLLPESTQDIAAGFCQLLPVNPVLNAQAIQQVQAVLRSDISSGTWSKRAATKTCNRAVHDRDTHLEGQADVCDRLAKSVMQMDGKL